MIAGGCALDANDSVNLANAEELARLDGEDKVLTASDELIKDFGDRLAPEDVSGCREGLHKECPAISQQWFFFISKWLHA